MRAEDLQIEQMRCHIVDRILTLQCPRCNAAFLDFNGCFALTCHRCRCGFCAYCLADCGNDVSKNTTPPMPPPRLLSAPRGFGWRFSPLTVGFCGLTERLRACARSLVRCPGPPTRRRLR